MIRVLTLLVVIIWACGCDSLQRQSEKTPLSRDFFLKMHWSPTHAYQVDYLDREALDIALREHDTELVLFFLEAEIKENWTYLSHRRFTPKYLIDLLNAMEDIQPGSGRNLLQDLTSEWRIEMQNDFRDDWLKTHYKARKDKSQ